MSYIPKSKINISETSGGDLVVKSTNQNYIGKYIELSNGKYYVGDNPSQLNEELIITPSFNKLGNNENTRIYNVLKPKRAKFQSEINPIYPSKNLPTQEDYDIGYYIRYFVKKVNEPRGYMEVSFDIFNSILQQKKEYDFYLYEIGSITWNLKNGTILSNFKNLQILERSFPFVSIIFPKLDEFEKIDSILTTSGGELYYEDGREYIGPYHIHPDDGPMVGAQHISEPHEKLVYSKDIQDQNQEIKNFLSQNLIDIQMQQLQNQAQNMAEVTTTRSTSTQTSPSTPSYAQSSPSTPSTSPSTPSSSPSSTGGGGY